MQQILSKLKARTAVNLKGQTFSSVLQNLLRSQQIESSYFLQEILKAQGKNHKQADIESVIKACLKDIRHIPTLTLAYSYIKNSTNSRLLWRDIYEMRKAGNMLEELSKWFCNHSTTDPIFRPIISLVINDLPLILRAEKISIEYKQFQSYLVWLSYFDIRDRNDYTSVCQAIKLVKQARLVNTPDYEHKGHLMLRRIIDLLGWEQRRNGSLFLLLQPLSIRENDIQYFCNVYEHIIEQLDEVYLSNIFKSLIHGGINRQILFFIRMVSNILQHNQQYYTLRYLYQNLILPIIAANYKTHKKLPNQIYSLVKYYVYGFLAHCKLDRTGIDCLIDHTQMLNKDEEARWIELALIACKDDKNLKDIVRKKSNSIGSRLIQEQNIQNYLQKNGQTWKVTIRNGRKLKKYPQIDSKRYKGITNRCNDCYIISTVQALLVTKKLPEMLLSLKQLDKKQKTPVLDELKIIFTSLSKRQEKLTITDLKKRGPEAFQTTNNQQDAQQYLIQLFNMLENQLKRGGKGLELFQSIFKIQYSGKFICNSCGQKWQKERNEYTYIYSYRPNENFELKNSEMMEGYPCRKCKKDILTIETTIVNQPQLLILHINRFSHEAVSKKKLGNKPIKRKLGNYNLAGFVSHRGANISAGHYIFYGRLAQERWAIFDDARVAQFSVPKEEEFERQLRSENTPYILFYTLENYAN